MSALAFLTLPILVLLWHGKQEAQKWLLALLALTLLVFLAHVDLPLTIEL